MRYTLHVNGLMHTIEADDDTPLLWVLRDLLDLKGTKFGCGIGACGACTVHLDGAPARSCRTPVSAVGDAKVTTIEGIAADPVGARVQQAWVEADVPQCGYCQSGQIMTATALLAQNKEPTDDDIAAAMDGNLCRCGTYERIRHAIKVAAGTKTAALGEEG